jgi:hypothetical protein
MAHRVVDADQITPTWGTFRMVHHELGGTAFGLNQIDFPPDKVGAGYAFQMKFVCPSSFP